MKGRHQQRNESFRGALVASDAVVVAAAGITGNSWSSSSSCYWFWAPLSGRWLGEKANAIQLQMLCRQSGYKFWALNLSFLRSFWTNHCSRELSSETLTLTQPRWGELRCDEAAEARWQDVSSCIREEVAGRKEASVVRGKPASI